MATRAAKPRTKSEATSAVSRELSKLSRDDVMRIAGALAARRQLAEAAGVSFGGRRRIYKALGYPEDSELTYDRFFAEHKRDALAKRVVRLPVAATWSGKIEVLENEDPNDHPPFETEFASLAQRTRMFSRLRRLDEVSRLGKYGCLLIGAVESGELRTPLKKAKPESIQYLSIFSEPNARITKWVEEKTDPRFGLPEFYGVKLSSDSTEREVHWSRIIHSAENLLEDDVNGEPALMALFNTIQDGAKSIGASAEAIWKVADRGVQWDLAKDAEVDDKFLEKMMTLLDEYDHDMRRQVPTKGVTARVLGSQMVDPRGTWDTITSMVSAGTGIPRRILFGTERGELASTEDRRTWAGVVQERRENFAEPDILRALVDRLISIGALPKPAKGTYIVKWPPTLVLSETEIAQNANTIASAIRAVADAGQGTGRKVVSVAEFREKCLGWPPEIPAEHQDEIPIGELAARADAAGVLVRAGYDPTEAAKLVGLKIEHSGLEPVTVREPTPAEVRAARRGQKAAA